jgi:hypothetical protein
MPARFILPGKEALIVMINYVILWLNYVTVFFYKALTFTAQKNNLLIKIIFLPPYFFQ